MENKEIRLDFFDNEGWQEYSDIPHEDWQYAVRNGDTRLGYMEFVVSSLEADQTPYTFSDPTVEEVVIKPETQVSEAISQRFPESWWIEEVSALDTRRGYNDWALAQQQELDDVIVIADKASPSKPRRRSP